MARRKHLSSAAATMKKQGQRCRVGHQVAIPRKNATKKEENPNHKQYQ
jgi:hypothetical protein